MFITYCDVTPLTASSQSHRPDQRRECSGWSSRIRERFHPQSFNYCICGDALREKGRPALSAGSGNSSPFL